MNAPLTVASFGFDSFLAGLIIGAYGVSRREALGCAVAFGACDAAASAVGSLWPLQVPPRAALAGYLLCPLLFLWAVRSKRALLYGLPMLLSLDNLCNATPAAMAPAFGASSAFMALWGLGFAALARGRAFVPQRD